MPWTGKEFASRHNHKLKGASADHAARQANAMLRAGVPEGVAIATANKHADKSMASNIKKRNPIMARLTSKERSKLPASDFAGPGRSYPVEDKAHARAAKGFAAMHHSPDKAAIDRKADKVLGKGKADRHGGMHPPTTASSNAKSGKNMRHGTTHATGQMASRFDSMSKRSGSTKY